MPFSGIRTSSSEASAPPRGDLAVIACGALAKHCAEIAERRGWDLHVAPLPPLLHNHPEQIAERVRACAVELMPRYSRVVIGYADCGTYGALDAVCAELQLARLPGLHCYDVFGGSSAVRQMFDEEPGTYVLTDYLVRSFTRSVLVELGLDRHPELHQDYFGHYTRVVWLAQDPGDESLQALAQEAAAALRLPLKVVPTADSGLELALAELLTISR
ncbi:MAG: DUF1638 domain-containing protein [Ornithinimicrobium sp.]